MALNTSSGASCPTWLRYRREKDPLCLGASMFAWIMCNRSLSLLQELLRSYNSQCHLHNTLPYADTLWSSIKIIFILASPFIIFLSGGDFTIFLGSLLSIDSIAHCHMQVSANPRTELFVNKSFLTGSKVWENLQIISHQF